MLKKTNSNTDAMLLYPFLSVSDPFYGLLKWITFESKLVEAQGGNSGVVVMVGVDNGFWRHKEVKSAWLRWSELATIL